MIKKLLITGLISLGLTKTFSQQVSGKIFKTNSTKPIYNVALLTNIETGTTTNKIGKFIIDTKGVETITFSCLGFATKKVSLKELKQTNFIIFLDETVNQLAEIQLNLATISPYYLFLLFARDCAHNFIQSFSLTFSLFL